MARLGLLLDQDVHVHHQDHNKLNCCPCNLIALPGEFNPSGAKRDPFTGEFMSIEQYRRRYASDYQDSETPF